MHACNCTVPHSICLGTPIMQVLRRPAGAMGPGGHVAAAAEHLLERQQPHRDPARGGWLGTGTPWKGTGTPRLASRCAELLHASPRHANILPWPAPPRPPACPHAGLGPGGRAALPAAAASRLQPAVSGAGGVTPAATALLRRPLASLCISPLLAISSPALPPPPRRSGTLPSKWGSEETSMRAMGVM